MVQNVALGQKEQKYPITSLEKPTKFLPKVVKETNNFRPLKETVMLREWTKKLAALYRPKLPTLWYEDSEGNKWMPDHSQGYEEPPRGYIYQWSRFPAQLEENCLRSVVREEVDACEHNPEWIKRTGGWIEGVKGRECERCCGTQVCKEEDYPNDTWPDEWDASGSRSFIKGTTGYPADLVLAMLRPSVIELARQCYRYGFPAIPFLSYNQAVLHASIACEKCLNVLCYRYGTKDGYPYRSKEWHKAGTSCELCEPKSYNKNK